MIRLSSRRGSASNNLFRRFQTIRSHITGEPQQPHQQQQECRRRNVPFLTAAGASALCAAFAQTTANGESGIDTGLSPKEFRHFKLKETLDVSHDTRRFRFELQPGQTLGLTVASCLVTRAPTTDEEGKPKFVMRPYTPTTQVGTEGYFDLVIKVYPNGQMSNHIYNLKPGDTLEMKGPLPKLPYEANLKKQIGMVAGGTGLTPMLQVIKHVLHNPEDNTQISLVYANKSSADILLNHELDDLADRHPNFKVFYVIDKQEPGWKGGVGHVSADLLQKALPPPSENSLILFCGPPGMEKFVAGSKGKDKSQGEVDGLLKELGYSKEQVFKF